MHFKWRPTSCLVQTAWQSQPLSTAAQRCAQRATKRRVLCEPAQHINRTAISTSP